MANNRVAVRLSIEGAEEVRTALVRLGADGEAALKRINFDTANDNGVRVLNAALQEGSAIAGQYSSALGPLGGILSSLGGGWLAAAGAAGALATITYKAIEAADAQAMSQARVAAILKATADASGLTASQIEAMAVKISESTNDTRDSVRDAAAELLTFKNISGDTFERTLELAADMSASFKMDLGEAVQHLGRALDDPIAGMNSLRRAGLDLSPAQKEVIANFEKTGDLAGAQKALLDALAEKLGGAGASQHTGVAGAAHDVSEAWNQMLVSFGNAGGVQGATESLDLLKAALDHIKQDLDYIHQHPGWSPLGWTPDSSGRDGAPASKAHSGFETPRQPIGDMVGQIDAFMGPVHQAQERERDQKQAIEDLAAALRDQSKSTSELSRYVDQKVAEAAKQVGLDPQTLKSKYPQQYRDLASAATADFNASHTKQFDEEAAKRAADVVDQKDYLAQLTTAYAKAHAQQQSAQDATLEFLLKGQSGYFAVAAQAIDVWAANQKKEIDAETAAELDALDKKKAAYDKDNIAFAGYQDAKTSIEQSAAAKRAAIDAEESQKREALARETQGALYQYIAKGSEDTNLALKQVAADGLKGFETALTDLISGSAKAGQAFKQMVAGILEELAKLLIEKYIISQLAKELDSIIGSGGGGGGGGGLFASIFGSAAGNAFAGGNVIPYAAGGVVGGGPVVVPLALMGEQGPEAIMPLKRGPDGKLGVAGGGGDTVIVHQAVHYHVGGNVSADSFEQLRSAHEQSQRDFAGNTIKVIGEAKSRGILK